MIPDELFEQQLAHTLTATDFPSLGKKYAGKIRDSYTQGKQRVMITTDKVSAFDRVITSIPFKGQVLNQMAMFWFEQTKDIVANHVVANPDPMVMVTKECEPLKMEAVVRAYITGVTSTSIWTHYQNGVRDFCGNQLPEGLKKDQALAQPIFTPSTKAALGDHDESISRKDILARGLITAAQFDQVEALSMALFKCGQAIAAQQQIILVDTKYEFGLFDGEIVLMDEIHTPDSSRFWHAETYEALFAAGQSQRKIDKEHLREWLASVNFTGDGDVPMVPDALRIQVAKKYIKAYEVITGQEFQPLLGDANSRIKKSLASYLD